MVKSLAHIETNDDGKMAVCFVLIRPDDFKRLPKDRLILSLGESAYEGIDKVVNRAE